MTDNHGDQLTYEQVWEKARVAMERAFHRSGDPWIANEAEGALPSRAGEPVRLAA